MGNAMRCISAEFFIRKTDEMNLSLFLPRSSLFPISFCVLFRHSLPQTVLYMYFCAILHLLYIAFIHIPIQWQPLWTVLCLKPQFNDTFVLVRCKNYLIQFKEQRAFNEPTDRHKQSTVIRTFSRNKYFFFIIIHLTSFQRDDKKSRHCGKFKLFELLKRD